MVVEVEGVNMVVEAEVVNMEAVGI